LQYATHLLPFASFLCADSQLQTTILSLILELPQTAKTASTLAELFPDSQFLEEDTRNKLDQMLKEWQDLFVTGNLQPGENVDNIVTGTSTPCRQTLAMLYYEKVRDRERQLSKIRQAFGAYHEKLFTTSDTETEDLLVGSRPFESCNDFLVCLDMFYSVGFGSCLESEGPDLPIIDAFASRIRQAQLEVRPAKESKKPKLMRSVSLQSSRVESSVAKEKAHLKNTVGSLPKLPANKHDLLRSHSVSEADLNSSQKPTAILQRSLSQPVKIGTQMCKSGLDIRNLTRLCDTNMGMENANNNNSNALHASGDRFTKSRCTTSLGSTEMVPNGVHIKPAFIDYLSESVLPPATVERLEFEGEIAETERLVEWLNGWAVQKGTGNNPTRSSAIRIRVSPQLLAYSLWLIESRYQHFTPSVSDITVAVVHGQVPASVPREPSRSSTLITNGSVGVETTSFQRGNHFNGAGSSATGQEVPVDHVSGGTKGRKKQKPVANDVMSDEEADGVNGQIWLQDIQDALSPQHATKSGNRSANNNADRSDLVVC